MVESACTRNRDVPQMLKSTDLTNLALFPSLFCVARQAPRSALNNMLIGLLVHGDHQVAALRVAGPSDNFAPALTCMRIHDMLDKGAAKLVVSLHK
jgi:hypothetical protein